MAASDAATRAGGYAQRLLDNEYVQENLADAVESLRDAYRRASKRRVKAARDKRVYERVRRAAASLFEAAEAMKTGRRRPKRRRGRRVIVILVAAGGGTAAALAANEDLRKKLLGGGSGQEGNRTGTPAAPGVEVAA
jgi:hypothetical protein